MFLWCHHQTCPLEGGRNHAVESVHYYNSLLCSLCFSSSAGGNRLEPALHGLCVCVCPTMFSHLKQWHPTLGLQMFLDFNSQKSWPAEVVVKASGSCSPRTSGGPRLGTTALMDEVKIIREALEWIMEEDQLLEVPS